MLYIAYLLLHIASHITTTWFALMLTAVTLLHCGGHVGVGHE
jgi:hypothetical protein